LAAEVTANGKAFGQQEKLSTTVKICVNPWKTGESQTNQYECEINDWRQSSISLFRLECGSEISCQHKFPRNIL
jgi:hypothetical protein